MSCPRLTREEIARLELGKTEIRPHLAKILVVVFLATAALPACLQFAVHTAKKAPCSAATDDPGPESPVAFSASDSAASGTATQRRLPWVTSLVGLVPSGRTLRGFEDQLNETSAATRMLAPWVGWVIKGVLHGGDEQAYFGQAGWLFYRPSVDSVTGPGFLTAEWQRARLRSADPAAPLPQPNPLKALIQFQRQLAARGIALVVVPTPGKESVQPERLTSREVGGPAIVQNPSFDRLTSELAKAGVDVFDPAPVLLERKRRLGEDVYLKTDTHWSPAAMGEVAERLAAHLRSSNLLPPAQRVNWQPRPETIHSSGDLTAMLNLPKDQRFFPPETVRITRVVTPTGQPWESDPSAAVLLLGDSFCNIYSLPGMGWGDSAGFAEHLSLELGQPVDRIVINAGGAASTRQELARQIASSRDRLAGKHLVIYEFAARELVFGDWKLIDLPATSAANPSTIGLSEDQIVRGRVSAIARLPRPGSVPYRDCLIAIHLTQVHGPTLKAGETGFLVYAMGMRDNRWLPVSSVKVGTDVQCRLRDWAQVESRYGGLNRAELDDLDLLSLPTYWAEEGAP